MRSFSAWLIRPMPVPDKSAGPVHHLRYQMYRHRREVKRFIKFSMVGAFGALIDFAILNILVLGLDWPKALANTVSFTAAVLSNFTWNRRWTYPEARRHAVGPQLGQFVLVNLIGLGINQLVFLSLDYWVFHPLVGELGFNLAKASAIVVVLFWNFAVNRLWTFRGL